MSCSSKQFSREIRTNECLTRKKNLQKPDYFLQEERELELKGKDVSVLLCVCIEHQDSYYTISKLWELSLRRAHLKCSGMYAVLVGSAL